MRNHHHRRGFGVLAALVLVAAPLAIASAAFAADPSVQSTATVANGEELREQWAIGNNTLITLTANVDLGVDGSGGNICDGDEPIRTGGDGIVIDGQGLFGITQTCDNQRVLRDDSEGETVTLQGLTHFTGGDADGNGGGLRNDGPVNVVNSDVSENSANNTCLKLDSAAVVCETGNGGGIFAGVALAPYVDGPGYDIDLTNSSVADNTATDNGGGLYTLGSLTTNNSSLTENTAGGWVDNSGMGGGAFADESVSSTNTSWTNNEADCNAFEEPPEPIAAADDGICSAVASGGGFFTYGSATVSGSSFTTNHAYDSGGGFFADDAVVDSSTFTGNQAGGESAESDGASAASLPGNVGNNVSTSATGGSAYCLCAGGGFAVGAGIGDMVVSEGGAQVTNSTFVANGAGCDGACLGGGGGFYAGNGATVSGSTFGDGSNPGANSAGCFESCGAMGGGFYSGGDTDVDTSTFNLNGVGCLGGCGAEGGGFFAGNGQLGLGAVSNAQSLPSDVDAALEGDGAVTVVQSTFTGNEAGCFIECGGSGGGFYAGRAPAVDVTASTFSQNDALWDGGAISVNGGDILNSVICDADCGGTDATITNSTITGNFSGYPAAISVAQGYDTLTLVNDTIDSNTIVLHDLLDCGDSCSNATAKAQECMCYAANVVARDLTSFGTDVTHPLIEEADDEPLATADDVVNCWVDDVNSEGFNFSDDDSCEFTDSTDNVADGNDPMLGALASNGGPTQTMLPLVGSPLIDAIQPVSECQVDVDQRGVSRPQIKGCDTGAVEVLGASLVVDKVVTGTAGNPVPANGYTFAVNCTDGTSTSVTVADATAGGSSETVNDIVPGAVCTVTEAPVVYTNANVVGQPVVSYDPAVGSPLGEGDTEVVTVTNNYEGINLLGIAVNLTPKFTG